MSELEMVSGLESDCQSFCGALRSCPAPKQDLQDLSQCPYTSTWMEFWSGFSLVVASLLALVTKDLLIAGLWEECLVRSVEPARGLISKVCLFCIFAFGREKKKKSVFCHFQ